MNDASIWVIVPKQAIGPLALGMSKTECVALLGSEFDEFRRTPDDEDVTLAFDSDYVHVVVSNEGHVKGISVFRPRSVSLRNVQLLDKETTSVSDELVSAGIKAEPIDVGLWCEEQGVVLVDVDGKVDGVELTS